MFRVLVLIIFTTVSIFADVIIRPRPEPFEVRYLLHFSNLAKFPDKVFILTEVERKGMHGRDEITNLSYEQYIQIDGITVNPLLVAIDTNQTNESFVQTSELYETLENHLNSTGQHFLKTRIELPAFSTDDYPEFDAITFKLEVTKLTADTLIAEVVSAALYIDGDLIEHIKLKSSNNETLFPPVLRADVAPEPMGIFQSDFLYFVLPLAGIIIFLFIRHQNKKSKGNL